MNTHASPEFHLLKRAFCWKHLCTESECATRLFWRTLHPHAKPVAILLYLIHPRFFAEDFDFIENVLTAASRNDVKAEINSFALLNNLNEYTLRNLLRLRVSARRLKAIASDLLPDRPRVVTTQKPAV